MSAEQKWFDYCVECRRELVQISEYGESWWEDRGGNAQCIDANGDYWAHVHTTNTRLPPDANRA